MPSSAIKSPETETDLRDIWRSIADSNVKAADATIDRIERTFGMLSEHPRSGRSRPELAPGLRSFSSEIYIIFYRIVADGVEVVRVMHGHRDILSKDMPKTRLI